MVNLRTAVGSFAKEADAYFVEAPEGWTQGRTLYGGMTAALCAQAAGLAFPDSAPLRSAQFAFMGPAAGRLGFRPALLRQGRSSTVVAVDCLAENGLAARALLTYGAARPSHVTHDLTASPVLAEPETCEPFFANAGPGAGFFQNFEMRLAQGARIFSPGAAPAFDVWVRHLDDEGVDPVISLLALADSLPPAAMVGFAAPAPISTMSWSLDILHPVERGEWRLLQAASEVSADGYSQQAMALWSREGRRLAVGRQTVAIFA